MSASSPTCGSVPAAKSGRLNSGRKAGLFLLIGAQLGCTGSIVADAGDGVGASGTPGVPSQAPTNQPGAFVPAPASMARLTASQYRNAVRASFGASANVAELDPDAELGGYEVVGARSATVSPRAAELYEAAARAVVAGAVGDATWRAGISSCVPSGAADASCAESVVGALGLRLWRRALDAAERTRFSTLARDGATSLGDFWESVAIVGAGMMQSPKFVFRIELGEPDPTDPSRLRYTSQEMASRLAFFVLNSAPGDALLATAQTGVLLEPAALSLEAERLLGTEEARAGLGQFLQDFLDLAKLPAMIKEQAKFPAFNEALALSMAEESRRLFEYVVFEQSSDLRGLVTTRTTFVDQALATHYGLPAPSGPGFSRVELPASGVRLGLLGHAAFLAAQSTIAETSPTRRGKFVRERLLCGTVPPPPPGAETTLEADDGIPKTRRQLLEKHRADPTCAGCHALTDPIGLAFEHFDAVGAYRSTEHGLTIDPSGNLDGVPFADAPALARLLQDDPLLTDCLVRQVYRYATGRRETEGETSTIDGLRASFSNGGNLQSLVKALVASPGFRFAKERN